MQLVKSRQLRPDEPVDILILGESPGKTEAEQGVAFVGPSGQLLDKLFSEVAPHLNYVCDNVVPEVLEGGIGKPTPKLVKKYRAHVAALIEQHKPKMILALGKYAMSSFGIGGGVTTQSGKVFGNKAPVPVVVGPHPAYVLRNPDEMVLYEQVFDQILATCKGHQYEYTVATPETLPDLLSACADQPCAIDLETSGLTVKGNYVISCAIAHKDGCFVVPLHHVQNGTMAEAQAMWKQIQHWWGKGMRIAHNIAFDAAWFRNVPGHQTFDTMIAANMIDENNPTGLMYLSARYLGRPVWWVGVDKARMNHEQLPVILQNNAIDAINTYDLYIKFKDEHLTEQQYLHIRYNVTPTALVLSSIQYKNGICVDVSQARLLEANLKHKAAQLRAEIDIEFPGLNIRSNKQMVDLLQNKLGLKIPFKTGKKKPSTGKETLKVLSKKEPRLKAIYELRQIESMLKKELEPILKSTDGLVYTSFGIGQTTTGRLTSSNPNLQNVTRASPTRKLYKGRWIRTLLQGDMSQFELRIMAYLAQCEELMIIFEKDMDPYQAVGDEICPHLSQEARRKQGKFIALSLIYGISAGGLSTKGDIPYAQAVGYKHKWEELYPEFSEYHRKLEADLEQHGYVENMFGRRRHNPDPNQLYNFPGQSNAAEIINRAMVRLHSYIQIQGCQSMIVHQIHDSIVVDVHPRERELMPKVLKESMEDWHFKNGLLLKADVNWKEGI